MNIQKAVGFITESNVFDVQFVATIPVAFYVPITYVGGRIRLQVCKYFMGHEDMFTVRRSEPFKVQETSFTGLAFETVTLMTKGKLSLISNEGDRFGGLLYLVFAVKREC